MNFLLTINSFPRKYLVAIQKHDNAEILLQIFTEFKCALRRATFLGLWFSVRLRILQKLFDGLEIGDQISNSDSGINLVYSFLLLFSVVDPNTLNLDPDPDPGFWINFERKHSK